MLADAYRGPTPRAPSRESCNPVKELAEAGQDLLLGPRRLRRRLEECHDEGLVRQALGAADELDPKASVPEPSTLDETL